MSNFSIIEPGELRAIVRDELRAALRDEFKPSEPFAEFPELLTRRQTAELLGVALATVDNWTKEDRLLKHRIGPVVRFRKSEVLAALTSLQRFQRFPNLQS